MKVTTVAVMEKAAFGLAGYPLVATIYCIDTSALIAAWYERYKPNRFPKLWEQLDQLIAEGRLLSSTLVLRERSKQRSEELHAWLKPREAMFITPDEAGQGQVDHIVNTYTALMAAA